MKMSKLQNIISPQNIQDVDYSDMMSTSYVNYAMSQNWKKSQPLVDGHGN